MKIILASGSPRRRELLDLLELSYEVIPSNKEEVVTSDVPSEVVKELSMMKAMDIAQTHGTKETEETLVIGADTVVACDNEILGKPGDEENAKKMLSKLSGRAHSVYTGIALLWIKDGKIMETVNKAVETKVYVEKMTEEEIAAYAASGEPLDKAGAYAIQGKFAAYISGIEGDYYNVMGLPVCELRKALKKGAFV